MPRGLGRIAEARARREELVARSERERERLRGDLAYFDAPLAAARGWLGRAARAAGWLRARPWAAAALGTGLACVGVRVLRRTRRSIPLGLAAGFGWRLLRRSLMRAPDR